MWYPTIVTAPPAAEPVTAAEVKRLLVIDFADDDSLLADLIAQARDRIEKTTGLRLAAQTIEMRCDGFGDFALLPEAPIASISAIAYVDTGGASQTLDAIYELRGGAGFAPAIVLQPGERWPATQNGSLITVTAVAGGAPAPAVKGAIVRTVATLYAVRENAAEPDWSTIDAMLINDRRNA